MSQEQAVLAAASNVLQYLTTQGAATEQIKVAEAQLRQLAHAPDFVPAFFLCALNKSQHQPLLRQVIAAGIRDVLPEMWMQLQPDVQANIKRLLLTEFRHQDDFKVTPVLASCMRTIAMYDVPRGAWPEFAPTMLELITQPSGDASVLSHVDSVMHQLCDKDLSVQTRCLLLQQMSEPLVRCAGNTAANARVRGVALSVLTCLLGRSGRTDTVAPQLAPPRDDDPRLATIPDLKQQLRTLKEFYYATTYAIIPHLAPVFLSVFSAPMTRATGLLYRRALELMVWLTDSDQVRGSCNSISVQRITPHL